MSILIIFLLGAVVLTISDAVEAAIIRQYKHTHNKRTFVNGGWKP